MKTKFVVSAVVSAILFLFVGIESVFATTVYYQPTPYPFLDKNGDPMSQEIDKVHLWDGWLPSYYYNQEFTRDETLQLGGWGDEYRTYIKFDIEGLPYSPDLAVLYLKSYSKGDSSTTTPFAFCKTGGVWDTNLTWDTQPSMITCAGWFSAPTPGDWWGINFTSWYNEWKNGTVTNNGIMMFPQNTSNNFDVFRSSRYTSSERPILRFDFTPTIQLKMPLPGNHTWLVTTEPGGWDCKGDYDQYHDGTNYFSVDFSWRNQADAGATEYNQYDDIPILAASDGIISSVDYNNSNPDHPNGYYVVIDHDYDNNLNTGVSTRYLHFKYPPLVSAGQSVSQGNVLGYMGDTGLSEGIHLHFGVRYQNNGSSGIPQLAKVIVDGQILKGYQTKCLENEEGVPTDWIRYYRSYNTAY